jgi:hypothetical protein
VRHRNLLLDITRRGLGDASNRRTFTGTIGEFVTHTVYATTTDGKVNQVVQLREPDGGRQVELLPLPLQWP